MSERLSSRARTVMARASHLARELGHRSVDTHHLLYGLTFGSSTASIALAHFGITPLDLRKRAIIKFGQQPIDSESASEFTRSLNNTIQRAVAIADDNGEAEVDEKHLLLAILDGPLNAGQYEIIRVPESVEIVRDFLNETPEDDNEFTVRMRSVMAVGTTEDATEFDRGAASVAVVALRNLEGR